MSLYIRNKGLSIREMAVFSMLGAIMFLSKILMEALPNIHLLGTLTMTYTLVYRKKALIPLYIYVILNGVYAGFSLWWVPYLYIWTVLWAAIMLLPKRIPKWLYFSIIPIICALHGFSFGVLYAPTQALFYGYNLEEMIAWISMGFYFDIIHGVSNFAMGFLVYPVSQALERALKAIRYK